jgi:hypothetical protein
MKGHHAWICDWTDNSGVATVGYDVVLADAVEVTGGGFGDISEEVSCDVFSRLFLLLLHFFSFANLFDVDEVLGSRYGELVTDQIGA